MLVTRHSLQPTVYGNAALGHQKGPQHLDMLRRQDRSRIESHGTAPSLECVKRHTANGLAVFKGP